jgi:hypothetical protein
MHPHFMEVPALLEESMVLTPYQNVAGMRYIDFYIILILNINRFCRNLYSWKTQLVLLRTRRNFKFLRDDARDDKNTTKIVNRRWHLPPTQKTSPIQPGCSIVFAVGFIITYLTLLQKESATGYSLSRNSLGIHQSSMVSSQTDRNAITAFCREPSIFVMKRAKSLNPTAKITELLGSIG